MPTFEYTAVDRTGNRVRGSLAGPTEAMVLAELEAKSMTPVAVRETNGRGGLRRRVKARPLAAAYSQLADLLGAGVPLIRGLELLGRQKSSPRLSETVREITDCVAQGDDLASAMAEHPEVFPEVHVAMVRAGERGGFIEQVFERLAGLVESQAELREKVRGSLTYPAIVIVFGSAVLAVVFTFFVPKFRRLIAERLDDVPAVTKLVFAISDTVAVAWWAMVLVPVLLLLVWRWMQHSEVWRRRIAIAQSRIPVVGELARAIAVARFCRLLGTMEANGVPLLAAMRVAREAAGNPLLVDAIDAASDSVAAGEPLAQPLGESGLFGDDVVEMIAVGEASGHIDKVLIRVAGTLEKRVSRRLDFAVELVLPIALAVIGGLIAIVAAGLILPLTQLSGSV